MFMENKFWMCIRNYSQGELIGFQKSLCKELFLKPYLPNRNNRRKIVRSDDKKLVSCSLNLFYLGSLPVLGKLPFEIRVLFSKSS